MITYIFQFLNNQIRYRQIVVMNKLLVFLLSIALVSCYRERSNEGKIVNSTSQDSSYRVKKDSISVKANSTTDSVKGQVKIVEDKKALELDLTTFQKIPDEIDGCGCYFFLSKNDEAQNRYLMVNDFANIAFISINNKLEKFLLKEHKENSKSYLYSNANYIMKVEITEKTDGGEESSSVKGVITITKGEEEIKEYFIGSCGC